MLKISLTGDLGSGKSTVCEILREKYRAKIISVGQIMREKAVEKGLTLQEYSAYMEQHPEEDNALDDELKSYENKQGDFIFDSRMAWHFVPSAFSFYLRVSLDESAKRIFNACRADENFDTVEKTREMIVIRRESEQKRYKDFYGVNILDMGNYNAVIETDGKSPEQVAEEIIDKYFERRN